MNQRDSRTPYHYEQVNQVFSDSPYRFNDNAAPFDSDSRYYNYPPISTYNRFSPLYDTYNNERNEHDQVQYGHSQYNHNSYGNKDFHQDGQGQKRPSDLREVPEGGGELRGKRRV